MTVVEAVVLFVILGESVFDFSLELRPLIFVADRGRPTPSWARIGKLRSSMSGDILGTSASMIDRESFCARIFSLLLGLML